MDNRDVWIIWKRLAATQKVKLNFKVSYIQKEHICMTVENGLRFETLASWIGLKVIDYMLYLMSFISLYKQQGLCQKPCNEKDVYYFQYSL
jgi:hypothetical protein